MHKIRNVMVLAAGAGALLAAGCGEAETSGSGGSGGGDQAYLDCLERAGSDAAKVQDCAKELSAP